MPGVFIISAVRTPIGKFGGSLVNSSAADMGVIVARAALERARLEPGRVDQAIFGCARQAGSGPNVARQIAWRADLGDAVPGYTVNQACGSGLKAILLAYQDIILGNAHCVLAGGTESMSRLPYYVEGARWGMKMGHQQLVDGMYRDGFFCPMSEMVMGETVERLAEQYKISRDEQDRYALSSQQRAERATRDGRFREEIVPVEIKEMKETRWFATDEHARAGTTLEALAKLSPVFSKTGTITAGNSSGITDAAAAVVVVSEEKVREWKLEPMARIVDYAEAGVDPRIMGIGPVPAVGKLLEKNNWRLDDFDLIELNEAFAAQVLACDRELRFDQSKLNVNGGAIALGHPIGCTGTRIVATLLHEMKKRSARRGLATLCISGGMGMAMAVEAAG